MGTLPAAEGMRRRLPQEGLAVIDVPDGSAIAAGAAKLGAGLQRVGVLANQEADQERRQTSALESGHAQVGFQTQLLAAKDLPSTDADYGTWLIRYDAMTKKAADDEAAKIADPAARANFRQNAELQIVNGRNLMGDAVRGREKDTRIASLNGLLTSSGQSAADPRLDPAGHDAVIVSAKKAIEESRARGDLSDVDAQKAEHDFGSAYAFNRTKRAIEQNPRYFATTPTAATPSASAAPISPETRQTLVSVLAKDKDAAQHIDKMKPRFAESLSSMLQSAPPEMRGRLGILSATRSMERQQELWDASDKTGRTVGRPGGSRHNHGDAADLSFDGMKLDDKRVPQAVRDWVRDNAPKHGLGLPMSWEPWHVEDFEARSADNRYGAQVRRRVAAARPDLVAASSVNRTREFPAVAPQDFFGAGVDVSSLPAGMRNNNPGNIKYVKGSALPGITGPSQNTDQGDPQAVFSSPQAGMTAMGQLLVRKFDGGRTTMRGLISANGGWTPGNEKAAADVARMAGFESADAKVNLRDPAQLTRVMRSLMQQEHGDASKRYSDDLVQQAAGAALGGEPVRFASAGGSSAGSGVRVASQRFDPVSINYLSPSQIYQLESYADQQNRDLTVIKRAGLTDAVENAPAAIENGGAYSGVMPSRADFHDAYGEEEGEDRWRKFDTAVDTAETARGFRSQSNEQINAALSEADPSRSTGDRAALDQQRYGVLQRAAKTVLDARAKDPAGYVIATMPNVAAAWEGVTPGSTAYANALRITAEAQKSLGIASGSIRLLPTGTADAVASSFKSETTSADNKLAMLTGAVFSTSDREQRTAIFNQLVNEGLPQSTESILEAASRGDTGAAKRLMQAAVTDPAKIPGKLAVTDDDIKRRVQSDIMDTGMVGDVAYGLSLGTADNYERATRDSELMFRSIKLRIASGQGIDAAISGVTKDLFGDKKVLSATSPSNIRMLVDSNADEDQIAEGLKSFEPRVREALTAQQNRLIERNPANTADGSAAITRAALANRIPVLMAEGTWRSVGDGVGFFDAYSGAFVEGADGKPLVFPLDDISRESARRDVRRSRATDVMDITVGSQERTMPGTSALPVPRPVAPSVTPALTPAPAPAADPAPAGPTGFDAPVGFSDPMGSSGF